MLNYRKEQEEDDDPETSPLVKEPFSMCFYDEHVLSGEVKEKTLGGLKNCIHELSRELRLGWELLLDEYTAMYKKPSNRVRQLIEDKNLHIPSFEIYGKFKGEERLKELGYLGESISDGDMLMVFRMPRVFEEFWWKNREARYKEDKASGRSERYLSEEEEELERRKERSRGDIRYIRHTVTEWGDLYHGYLSMFWNIFERSLGEEGLCVRRRINQNFTHTNEYYYLMVISKKEFPEEISTLTGDQETQSLIGWQTLKRLGINLEEDKKE